MTVNAVNDAPVVTAGADKSGNENDTVPVSATFIDVESGDTHTCSISWGDGSASSSGTVVESSGAGTCSGSHKYFDDNPTGTPSDKYTVTITVTDNGSPPKSGSDTLEVTIANLAPVITGMSGPSGPVAQGGSASVTTNYTDVGYAGHAQLHLLVGRRFVEHDRERDRVGSWVLHRVAQLCGRRRVHGRRYRHGRRRAAPRRRSTELRRRLRPERRASSPAAAGSTRRPAPIRPDPTPGREGELRLRLQVQEGRDRADGQTEFQFQAGNLNFHSDGYEWLVVAGAKAQYKGTGTVNGAGGYGFMLTATTGRSTAAAGPTSSGSRSGTADHRRDRLRQRARGIG